MTLPVLDDINRICSPAEADESYRAMDFAKSGFHHERTVNASRVVAVSAALVRAGYFLECLSACDFSDCFELSYIWNRFTKNERLVIKVLCNKDSQTVPSIQGIIISANWYEREVYDMFGITFSDHPDLTRLLLPSNTTIFPLRKDFKGEADGSDVKQVTELLEKDLQEFEIVYPKSLEEEHEVYHMNLGPQHPSTHGVLRVILELKGEKVLGAQPVIGYVHRNHEKMAEIQEYKAFWPNMGRLDYVGAMSYNMAYAGLIEKAMQVEVSERTEFIRVITIELNRIASHLLWLGTYLLDLGAFTPFFYCFDDRERILEMLEYITGERLTYDYFRFGGVLRDVDDARLQTALDGFIPHFNKRLKDYSKLIGDNVIFQKRTKGVGTLTSKHCVSYGITGPCLRACGVEYDIRRTEPYSMYDKLDFKVPTTTEGDAFARYLVRMEEIHQSLSIVESLYKKIPAGDVSNAKLPRFVPKGEYYYAVESARGSFGIQLYSDGSMQPYRLKLRTPSFSNLNALGEMARGSFVADMISILGSIDIVIPEIDR